jgi:seryl-tRNA synthetase
MEQREKLLEEREQLKEEFKRWHKKYVAASNKQNGLLPKFPNTPGGVKIPTLMNTEYLSEYKNVEKEKMEADAKRREAWEKILEINAKLQQ